MGTINKVIQSANNFYDKLENDSNGRYKSWEYCYVRFYNARKDAAPDIDYLSLHLAFFLASWGMYRGSSFILQKDYKIHMPAVVEILKPEYDCLLGCECKSLRNNNVQQCLSMLETNLTDYYEKVRHSVKEAEIKSGLSSTLITKILMGTLGCAPAYDRYFIDGIKQEKISTGNYNIRSLLKLVKFYEDNESALELTRKNMNIDGIPYPQMKLLDMAFWQIGYDADKGQNR